MKKLENLLMTMYRTNFLPLTLVVIYRHLISLQLLYRTEVIQELGGGDFQLPYFCASESAEPLIKLGCSYQTIL